MLYQISKYWSYKSIQYAVISVLAIIIIAATCLGAYAGTVLWIKKIGITVKPSKAYQPAMIQYYLQNDPRWRSDSLGTSDSSMGRSGCLVTSIAASIDYLGVKIDPKELNKVFTEKNVYTAGGEVIWYKIKEVVPGIDYYYQRIFGRRTLENDLKQGRLPIVQVRYNGKGIFHWVLIVGADEEDFLIMDPLRQDKQLIKLSTHGKVYAYRVMVKTSSNEADEE